MSFDTSTRPPQTKNEPTGTTAATADDRRRSQREPYVATAWLSAEAGTKGSHQQVVVNDLSLHGVGFTAESAIDEGATHWIVIGAGGLRASSRIRVATVRQREDGAYDIGAEFF